jgi:FixJ family two-component response regulator
MPAETAPVLGPVLVVDDDDAVRKSLKFMLELEGLAVRLYESGHAVLEDRDLPARGCMVVDQKMPRMSGVELSERLKARDIRLPIILVTSPLTAELAFDAVQAGVVAVLEKPIHDGGLLKAIWAALAAT